MTEKPDLPKRLSTDDRRRDLPRHVELWTLLLDEKNKGKGRAKPRDGYPRQDGRRDISPYRKKLEAEEKERRFDEKERRFDEKKTERSPLPRKNREVEQENRPPLLRSKAYYDDDDTYVLSKTKTASRPRRTYNKWVQKVGESGPRHILTHPPRRLSLSLPAAATRT